MSFRTFAALFLSCFYLAATLFAQQISTSAIGAPQTTEITLTVGYGEPLSVQMPPPPLNVAPGARVHLLTGYDESNISSIVWLKNDVPLPDTSKTLTFSTIAESDSGVYRALITPANGDILRTSSARVRVTTPVRQQLVALSTRSTITPASPVMIAGFVVAPSPSPLSESKYFLIRAVGPSLSAAGVAAPLAAPKMRLFNAQGVQIQTHLDGVNYGWNGYSPDIIAQRVGAAPFLPNSRDVAWVMNLSAGIYTVHVASADGGSGDALVEIYEVPDEVLLSPPIVIPEIPNTPVGSAASESPGIIHPPSSDIMLPPIAPSDGGL